MAVYQGVPSSSLRGLPLRANFSRGAWPGTATASGIARTRQGMAGTNKMLPSRENLHGDTWVIPSPETSLEN